MHRFFVSPSDIHGNTIQLSGDDIRHIRSLRLRPSEFFVVCDGDGTDYVCKLREKSPKSGTENADSAEYRAAIVDTLPSIGEPVVRCSVFLAYSKGDRLDYAVQKSVELGAYEITLFPSARCVAIPTATQKKTARLQKIALETAKQCNRGRVPMVYSAKTFSNAITQAAQSDLRLFFYEVDESVSLKMVLEDTTLDYKQNGLTEVEIAAKTISFITGPEGGFEEHEADAARRAGFFPTSLGNRILRSETAPAAALAAIMYYFGEM